ncbi:MAG: DUF6167 family protein [Marmoricola sp.]
MRRGFWFAAGAGAGIYVSFRARRVAEAFTSDGISDRIAALQLGGRLLREDIATGAAHKETELRERIAESQSFVTALRASSTSEAPALPAAEQPQEKELN